MPKYMLDYIRLCSNCNLSVSTLWNMRMHVIPALQREASETRLALEMIPECRPELEKKAEILEAAIRAGVQRCNPQPEQQELFAA